MKKGDKIKDKFLIVIMSFIANMEYVKAASIPLYGPPNIDDKEYNYFIKIPDWEGILKILSATFIPFIILLGFIVYLRKSKANKNKKVIITILTIILIVISFIILLYV